MNVHIDSAAWEQCQNISGILVASWIMFAMLGIHYMLVLNQYQNDGEIRDIKLDLLLSRVNTPRERRDCIKHSVTQALKDDF